MASERQARPAIEPYPSLRLMGEIDWTEDIEEAPPKDAMARAYAVPSGRGRVDDRE